VALPAAGLPLLAAAGQGASLPVLPVLPMAAASPAVAALPTAAALPGDARAAALAFGPHVQALTGDAGQAQPAGLRFMGAGAGVAAAAPVLAATAQESADAAQPAQAHLLVQSGPGSRLLKSPSAAELAALAAGKLEPESAQATEQTAASQAGRQLLQDTLKLRLKPLEGITQRLAAMAGTGEQALWARISGQAAAPLEALALGLGEEGALGAGLNSEAEALPTAGHGSAHSSAHASVRNAVAAEAQQAASTAGERVAQYEQLAQRLGRALGERLQAQIERGEWKVRMQVDPASLGRIEMELDMRAGGLDAVFRSDNQLTRELINQSLPRLRETLAQSGTAVANVWVQGDSSRQSGGNPTPGREGRPERGLGRPEAGEPAALVEASRPRRDASAWDLLA
jgi:flagellar hook-length control protein FliK